MGDCRRLLKAHVHVHHAFAAHLVPGGRQGKRQGCSSLRLGEGASSICSRGSPEGGCGGLSGVILPSIPFVRWLGGNGTKGTDGGRGGGQATECRARPDGDGARRRVFRFGRSWGSGRILPLAVRRDRLRDHGSRRDGCGGRIVRVCLRPCSETVLYGVAACSHWVGSVGYSLAPVCSVVISRHRTCSPP